MDHNHNPHLGVSKNSKSIRKSPLHQPNFHHHQHHQQQPPPPPQPQVYNISKNDFRTIVQQLTGTPTRDPHAAGGGGNATAPQQPPPPSRPPHPKPSSMRLQKIRPPPLNPIARPPPPPFQNPNPGFFPPRPSSAVAESPVSAYMKYLESSLLHSDGRATPQFPAFHNPNPNPGLLPSPASQLPPPPPPFPAFPSPRGNPNPITGLLPSPGLPTSPSLFLNLLSPKSPYPLLSPGFQYPPPLTPNFSFSPLAQNGILGPGSRSHPPLPPSPGLLLPPSPSGFFPVTSPRWRDM